MLIMHKYNANYAQVGSTFTVVAHSKNARFSKHSANAANFPNCPNCPNCPNAAMARKVGQAQYASIDVDSEFV